MSDNVLQYIWRWSGYIVARRPKLVLVIVSIVSTGCFITSLCLAPLPSFADPSLGFETRGTVLGKRLISFENILDSIGIPSIGTSDRPLLSKVSAAKSREKRESKPNRPLKFCLQPSSEYGQVVLSGWDLWSLEEVRYQCQLETRLISSNEFSQLCDRSAGSCCPPWSLPNTIAFLHNKTSCHHITKEDVMETKELVEECRSHYISGSDEIPVYTVKGLPKRCRRKKAIFNLIYYMLDSNYKSAKDRLEHVLVILPVAQSSTALPYYHSLKLSSLHIHNLSISAINLGVKDAVFGELLVKESWLLICGAAMVALCLFLYTASIILTIAIIISVLFSISLAYFLYTVVFRFNFFPFINVLSSVVAIGVGSDSSLILYKVWYSEAAHHRLLTELTEEGISSDCSPRDSIKETRVNQVIALYRISSLGFALTSLTTAVAFFSSYVSNITSLACFGVFSGSVVLSNLMVTWWWMPACLVLTGSCQKVIDHQASFWLLLKPRWLWLTIFPVITLLSGLNIYHHGGLPMSDNPSFHLLLPSHPLEKFQAYSTKFHLYRHHPSDLSLRWIWGVQDKDTGDMLDPSFRGKLHLDQSFNLSEPESQIFFYDFCRNIRHEEWFGGGPGVVGGRCFPEAMIDWMKRSCLLESDKPCCEVVIPLPPPIFSECAVKASQSIEGSLLSHPLAGPYFLHPDNTPPFVRVLIIEFPSNRSFTASYNDMQSFYKQVEDWTVKQLSSAPQGVSKGWFLSDLGLFDLQHSLRHDTIASMIIASLFVMIIVTISTRNLRLAGAATVTVASSTLCVASLLVLLGWKLDVLESSTASLAVGLSVDFTIHYALHYKANGESRNTLESIAGPLLICMVTSCLAGAAMIPSQTLPYRRVAVFLLVLMPISYLYSTLFFLSLLRPGHPSSSAS